MSGARELKDGRILISDAKRAAVYVIDPKAGTTQQIGSAGGGETQYAQPGGFYAGVADTIYLLDRAQARVVVISPTGTLVGTRSIRRKGVTGSSNSDIDFQQVDSRVLSYFVERSFRLNAGWGGDVGLGATTSVRSIASALRYHRPTQAGAEESHADGRARADDARSPRLTSRWMGSRGRRQRRRRTELALSSRLVLTCRQADARTDHLRRRRFPIPRKRRPRSVRRLRNPVHGVGFQTAVD